MKIPLSLVCAVAVMLLPGQVAAQIVPIKTVPIAEGDQFTFLPSTNRGMAHVSIALRDSLLDPYTNPATAARFRTAYGFGAMTSYVISRNAGDGTTLPAGAMLRSKGGSAFVGLVLATQRLSPGSNGSGTAQTERLVGPGSQIRTDETNNYVHALMGRSAGSFSFAGSLAWSRLGGIDGADQLYPASKSVAQRGDMLALRAGVIRDWSRGRSAEAVLVHSRNATTHDVTFEEFLWNPATRSARPQTHVSHNYDQTHLWGAQLRYMQSLADSGWHVGALLTANRTAHPTVPTFGMMTLARDPGRSAAFNAGLGMSGRARNTTFAADAIYEPVWARGPDGASDNRYRFSNGIVRGGVRREFDMAPARAEVQLGVQVHSIGYTLDKRDLLLQSEPTRSHKRWNEWAHSVGLGYNTSQFQVRYQWRLTSGVERVGFLQQNFPVGTANVPESLILPNQPAQLSSFPIRVTTQQLSVMVPFK